MARKIHFMFMMQNELDDAKRNVERALPYVDTITILDNGSKDGSIYYFRNWAQEESKLRLYVNNWENDFPKQRNKYVAKVNEIATIGDWCINVDPDEFLSDESLEKLHRAADRAEQTGHNMIGYQCISRSKKGPVVVHENLDDYWKELFFRWDPNFHFSGYLCHEGKSGIPHNIMRTTLTYTHEKQENIIWLRGFRNLTHAGGGPNLGHSNPRWTELLQILASHQIAGWHQLYDEMIKGHLHQDIKEWMLKYYDLDGFDGASEHREAALSYFVLLHPEEVADLEPTHQEYFRSKGARW